MVAVFHSLVTVGKICTVCGLLCLYVRVCNIQPAGHMNQVRSIVNCQLVHLPRFFERFYSKRVEQLTTLTATLAALPRQAGLVRDLRTQLVLILLFVLHKNHDLLCC